MGGRAHANQSCNFEDLVAQPLDPLSRYRVCLYPIALHFQVLLLVQGIALFTPTWRNTLAPGKAWYKGPSVSAIGSDYYKISLTIVFAIHDGFGVSEISAWERLKDLRCCT